MKRQVIFTRKELNEYIDEQANIIIEKMFKNKNKISENRERFKTEKRLTNKIFESMMWKMGLKKSVRLNETIGEAGHLYGHYEDGTPFTNSTDTWRGVKGTTFISHGELSDPEIWYKGKELNANDIEDGLWDWYKEECSENNEQPTEQGYEQWLETQDLASYLDDVLLGMNESKRRNTSKYVNETIGEAGHLYGHYEDGTPFTNSKETYRGVPGSIYIWHGAWSDPEVIWKGVSLNANDIEDRLWYSYEDRCEENGEEPTEQGYDAWVENEDIASTLDELVWAAQGNPQ